MQAMPSEGWRGELSASTSNDPTLEEVSFCRCLIHHSKDKLAINKMILHDNIDVLRQESL